MFTLKDLDVICQRAADKYLDFELQAYGRYMLNKSKLTEVISGAIKEVILRIDEEVRKKC